MNSEITVGRRIPQAIVGYLRNGAVETIDAQEIFVDGTIVAIGVPGAFTPVCTQQHIPDFVRNAEKLKQSGFSNIVCIAPNDPFTLDAWAQQLDLDGKILFLSDGNLDLTRALGLTTRMTSLLLGERCERFMIITRRGVIQRVRVEETMMTFCCTGARDALLAA